MFLPDGERSITTMSSSPERPDELALSWMYVDEKNSKDNERPYFVQHVQFPIQNERQTSGVIIEARIYVESMRKHLSELKSSDGGYAILYHHSFDSIKPLGAQDNDLFHNGFVFPEEMESIGIEQFQDGDTNYALTYIESPSLKWTLVDFVPVEKVLKPIATTRTWFYLSVSLLLCLGVASAWLLYTQIHRPVDRIKDSILAFKKGNYGVRMEVLDQKEFAIAMNGFNDMAEQIQTLIEQVFEEKIRSQDATLKLLQAQIDPHFLYNCLFYIKNMAKVRNTDAVEAMALHLGDYFRYRTKVEQAETTISEELELVDNFLAIHALRKRLLEYSISVAEELKDWSIPRLLVQPIVENAIVHAIEEIDGIGTIRITGENKGGYCRISVEDNGGKLGQTEIDHMVEALEQEEVLTENYGMRNVHQRLRKRYGGRSGLRLSLSSLGGLQVDILWEEMNSYERRG
ncbi:histidine kinase [Bacillus sp. JCM 19041]|uniref:sensor histidine kinase n=1 Tax=Bacillus sp. JCM 19041 TaxID=1460637 RepID=UPI0006CFA34D